MDLPTIIGLLIGLALGYALWWLGYKFGQEVQRQAATRSQRRWEMRPTGERTAHVIPVADTILHDSEDCPCIPKVEPVPHRDGAMGWLITHHSLDGREFTERGETIPKEGS